MCMIWNKKATDVKYLILRTPHTECVYDFDYAVHSDMICKVKVMQL
jgi:hypothetical protein